MAQGWRFIMESRCGWVMELLRGPFGRGQQRPQALLCCPAGAVPKVPSSDTWGQLRAGQELHPSTQPPSPLIPAHRRRKIPFGTQLPVLSSACPLFHPKPCRAIDPAIFLLTRGALPGSGMTRGHGDAPSAAGSASQLKVHPRASLLPLSCPPPLHFPFSKASLLSSSPRYLGHPPLPLPQIIVS